MNEVGIARMVFFSLGVLVVGETVLINILFIKTKKWIQI
jgi:hypothetical protein